MEIDRLLSKGIELARSTSGRRRVRAMTEDLDEFLDVYSTTAILARASRAPTISARIASFYDANRQLLWAGIFVVGAGLSRVEVPATVYPAHMLRDFVRDVGSRTSSTPSRALLRRVQRQDEVAWAAFASAMLELGARLLAGAWPGPDLARRTLEALRDLRPCWARVETSVAAELRHEREARKDPARRRALMWYHLCEGVLGALACPERGQVRLVLEYLVGLLAYFELSSSSPQAGRNRAACTGLVLEVFSALSNLGMAGGDGALEYLTLGSRGQDSCTLRKQLQKVRLRSGCLIHAERPRVFDDRSWTTRVLPALEEIGSEESACA